MFAALNPVSVVNLSVSPIFGQMVNVGFGPAGILGLCLAGAGAGLYLLRSTRPELARDYDIFFSAIGLLCGGILFFNGWRLDPILMFGQVLMAGSAVFFAFESIRLRSITTDQARRGSGRQQYVDDDQDYESDRVYRAELDEIEPFMNDRPPVRRIRGSRDSEEADRAAYEERYSGDYSSEDSYGAGAAAYSSPGYSGRSSRRSSSRRRSRSDRSADRGSRATYDATNYGDRSDYGQSYNSNESVVDEGRSSSTGRSSAGYSSGRRSNVSDWESSSSRRSESSRSRSSSNRDRYYDDEPPAPRNSRRPRPDSARDSQRSSRSDSSSDDYVDYKPISTYSDRGSSTYGSRRPQRNYDDEWGES